MTFTLSLLLMAEARLSRRLRHYLKTGDEDCISRELLRREGCEKVSKELKEYGDRREIEGVVIAYRDARFSDDQIKAYLKKKYKLSGEEADGYLKLVAL